MSSTDETALLVAIIANVAGIAVAFWMWRRHRRQQRTLRSRHPSARPVVRVDLVDAEGARRIRLGVPPGAPEVTVDIVSFRPQEPTGAWEGEPLDEPLVLRPGDEAVLTSQLPADVTMLDVVVAWTARHDTGVVQESRLFRLPSDREEPPTPARAGAGLSGRAALGLVAVLTGSTLLVASSIAGGDSDGEAIGPPTTTPIAVVPTSTVEPSPGTSTIAPTSTAPSAVETTADSTVTTTSTAPTTTTTGATTTSPAPTSTTAPVADGPQVLAEGRIEPCRFGDECLVVGFTITGFDGSPTEYVCEFDDGERFVFTFVGDGAEVACATGSPTATITVEVAGVRSETISRP